MPHCLSLQRFLVHAHRLWEGTAHWKRSAAAASVFAELGHTPTYPSQLATCATAEEFRYVQGGTRNSAGHPCCKPFEQRIAEPYCYSVFADTKADPATPAV